MRRREFITVLGGAALAWPLPAAAQQAKRQPVVGLVSSVSPVADTAAAAPGAAPLRGFVLVTRSRLDRRP